MMITRDDLEESVLEIKETIRLYDETQPDFMDQESWERLLQAAQAILNADTAQLNALLPDTHVVVPKFITRKLKQNKARMQDARDKLNVSIEGIVDCELAMIKAAEQEQKEGER